MAWNRTTEPAQPPKKDISRLTSSLFTLHSYFLIGLAAVAVCVAAFFIFSGGDDKPKKAGEKRSAIKEVGHQKIVKSPQPKSATKRQLSESAVAVLNKIETRQKPEIVRRKISEEEWNRLTNRVFNTSTEQVMSWVFSTEPGDLPMPIPNLDEEEKKNIVSILISKNQISDTDTEAVAFCKQQVDAAKKEMVQYIADGGDPDQFLQYYFQELHFAYNKRNDAIDQVQKVIQEEPEIAEDLLAAVNERLEKDGIKKITTEDIE